jgi:hypothetical protein
MLDSRLLSRLVFVITLLISTLLPLNNVHAATGNTPYVSLHKLNTVAAFAGSALAGVTVNSTAKGADVRLNSSSLQIGRDKTMYKKAYWYGTLESPALTAPYAFDTLIPSWNAITPAGTWLQLELRAARAADNEWTKYYNLGVWASGKTTILRRSIKGQRDGNGTVSTDTLRLSGESAYTRFQYRLTLFTANQRISPSINLIAVMTSNSSKEPQGLALASDQQAWGVELSVPQRSQMIYKGGGEVWCSPTSVSMLLAYWGKRISVPVAADATYDHTYRGNGNWPFNTAWAGANGFEAYITRFSSMAQVEEWISAGVPVIMSYAVSSGELPGTPYRSSSGHIMVIRGFDAQGNVILNDPAFGSDKTVRVVYDRAKLEELWLKHSGGTVYLIYPKGHPIPTDKANSSW